MNNKSRKKLFSGLVMSTLILVLYTVPASSEPFINPFNKADFTEGGHLETDYGVNFMAEWWYLNGKTTLVASDGEKKDIGFFMVLAHQESPLFEGVSHMLTFNGLYSENGATAFNYDETYVPRDSIDQFIALRTPYVNYKYPEGSKKISGSALTGYYLKYVSAETKVDMDLYFKPEVEKTIDHADNPLNFTTYEQSYGTLHGSIILDGKRYWVTKAEGYMDHMIPVSNGSWPMDMHGWNWFEVTTENYQVIAYAVRGLGDGYNNYSYKHLTLLNKKNGEVLNEYTGDEISIMETDWFNEPEFNMKRPSKVIFSTRDLDVTVNAGSVIDFNRSNPALLTGFVDFMAFEPKDAKIRYNGDNREDDIEEGSAFYEYLVSDLGAKT